jgi:nucleoside-diphosphate-sugar epimerase
MQGVPIMADKLIIGCGYLGQRIAALWCAHNHRVFATTRSKARADEWHALGLQPILCDVLGPASLRSLPRVESIAYCIGLDRSTGVSMHSLYVGGLANVLAALPQPAPRIVYVSSTSVYGQTDGEEVDESATTEPQGESGKVVLEAERLLRARLPSAVILRFAGIYGPGRLMRGQAIKAGEPIVGDAEKWLNLIHVEDGAAVVVAADERAAPGSIYNVSDGFPVRRRVFYTKLAGVLRSPQPRFIPLPHGAVVPPQERGCRQIVSRRMLEELGVTLRYPDYEAGLVDCV